MAERTDPKPLLRVSEVAADLGISRQRAYELVGDGTIPSVRIGPRNIRVPRASYERWISGLAVEAAVNSVREPALRP